MSILQLKQVNFSYAKSPTAAVRDLNFEINQGINVGVIGESGAGKTTILSLLLGLRTPTSGEIRFHDHPLRLSDRQQEIAFRTDVQAVFQDPYSSLDPRRNVGAIVLEPLRSLNLLTTKADRYSRVIESLESVDLDGDLISRFPHELSGGQRQRVAIARALATHPSLIVADEPTSALDVTTKNDVIDLFKRLGANRNLTIVMVSHDVSVVAALCPQILVLNRGKIVESGATATVIAEPAYPYTKELLRAVPRLPQSRMENK